MNVPRSFKIDSEDWEKFKKLSKDIDSNPSRLIRSFVREFIKKNKK